MGWSCSDKVGETLDLLRKNLNPNGVSNGWDTKSGYYFYELSNTEHLDGAATGKIIKEVPGSRKPDGSSQAIVVGSFRIEPNGKFSRGPKAMRKAVGQ